MGKRLLLALVVVVVLVIAASIVARRRSGRTLLALALVGGLAAMAVVAAADSRRRPPALGGGPSRSENEVREILQRRTGRAFPTVGGKDAPPGPRWLVNREGYPLELDGYCPELGLAFEFQGPTHYAFYPAMDGDRSLLPGVRAWAAFECPRRLSKLEAAGLQNLPARYRSWLRGRRNDYDKRELLRAHGVTLLEIPYTVRRDDYEDYILSRLADDRRGPPSGPARYIPPASSRVDYTSYRLVGRVDPMLYPPDPGASADAKSRRVPGSWLRINRDGTILAPSLERATLVPESLTQLEALDWAPAVGMPGLFRSPRSQYLMDGAGDLFVQSPGPWLGPFEPGNIPPNVWELQAVPMDSGALEQIASSKPPPNRPLMAPQAPASVPKPRLPVAPRPTLGLKKEAAAPDAPELVSKRARLRA